MRRPTLHDHLLNGGVQGRIYRGIVGGKIRSYTPVGFNSDNNNTAVMLVNLTGKDIPKRIIERRKEQAKEREAAEALDLGFLTSILFNHDYIIPLNNHYQDIYAGDLKVV